MWKPGNETARSIRFTTPIGIEEFNFTTIFGKNTFETTIESDHWMIVDVLDSDRLILHRWISWEISGIDIRTNLEQGEHRLALVNGGKAEVFFRQHLGSYLSYRFSNRPNG